MSAQRIKTPIIKEGETLVIRQKNGQGFSDTSIYQSAADVLFHCDENTVDIIQIDNSAFHMVSIADDMAAVWIETHTDLTPDDDVPLFVSDSWAWEAFVTDWNAQAADDRRYGSYQKQHRLGVYNTIGARHV